MLFLRRHLPVAGRIQPGLFERVDADLKQDHTSRPRNPLIADVLHRRGLVERWGRGTQKIVEICVEAGHLEPEFVEASGPVGVRFLPSGYVTPLRISHDLTERQREILQALAEEGSLPLREIRAKLTDVAADRTLQDDLAHLRNPGLIESVGRCRGAYYQLLRVGIMRSRRRLRTIPHD